MRRGQPIHQFRVATALVGSNGHQDVEVALPAFAIHELRIAGPDGRIRIRCRGRCEHQAVAHHVGCKEFALGSHDLCIGDDRGGCERVQRRLQLFAVAQVDCDATLVSKDGGDLDSVPHEGVVLVARHLAHDEDAHCEGSDRDDGADQ